MDTKRVAEIFEGLKKKEITFRRDGVEYVIIHDPEFFGVELTSIAMSEDGDMYRITWPIDGAELALLDTPAEDWMF